MGKVQGSLRSSLGDFGNRVMVVSGIATWEVEEVLLLHRGAW